MDEYKEVLGNQPVVIDNGSGVLKAGMAGDEVPKTVFPAFLGSPKHKRVMVGALDGDHFVGTKAEELRGLLRLKYPIENGIVKNWADMERVWEYLYQYELKVPSSQHPVLLTEAPLNPRRNRERSAEILFETFNVPALYVSMQAVLALYASARTTGLVLDVGDGVSHAVPVYEGFALPHSVMRLDAAGRDVTDSLQKQLRRAGYAFHTSAEREIVRQVKEQACYVALHPDKEEAAVRDKSSAPAQYRLPDGNVINLGPERFRAPELLFNPHVVGLEYPGVHECVVHAIARSDLDLRATLFKQIVLSGGSTLFNGFGERLLREVRKLAPSDVKIHISAPVERKYSTWIGGSIFASLAAFRQMWITAEEYAEDGASVLHRKTF